MSASPAARRLLRRLLATLPLILLTVLLGPAEPASAHAYLSGSWPADGATVSAPPSVLRLQFSESVDLTSTRIDVVDEAGTHHSLHALRIARGDDTEEPSTITAALPSLARGVYRVSWETLSSDDLHRTSGVFGFGIGRAVARTAFAEPLPRPEETVLRWLAFGALALACGGLVMGRLVGRLERPGGSRARSTAHRWALFGAALGPLVAVALLGDQLRTSGTSLTHLLGTDYGARWSLREVGLLVLLTGVLAARRPGRVAGIAIAIGTALAAVGTALLGHSAAAPGTGATRVLADAAHLVAAATWTGALVVAGLTAGRGAAAVRPALRSFATVGLACLTTLVVTGVYLTSGVVGSVDAALYTWYGRAVLLKVGLLGLVVVVAAMNHRRVRRSSGPWRRTVVVEALALGLALAAAAFLTSGQPAREPQFVSASGPAPSRLVDAQVADLQQRVQLSPNRPGRDVVLVDVFDTRRPAPAPIARVLVRILDSAGGGPATAAPAAATPLALHGRWAATVTVPDAGTARIEVTVIRPGLRPVVHAFGWVVGGRNAATRPAQVSTAPIGRVLRDLSIALLVAALLAWAAGTVWRRRVTGPPTISTSAAVPAFDAVDAAERADVLAH